jgi:hypothetical protein
VRQNGAGQGVSSRRVLFRCPVTRQGTASKFRHCGTSGGLTLTRGLPSKRVLRFSTVWLGCSHILQHIPPQAWRQRPASVIFPLVSAVFSERLRVALLHVLGMQSRVSSSHVGCSWKNIWPMTSGAESRKRLQLSGNRAMTTKTRYTRLHFRTAAAIARIEPKCLERSWEDRDRSALRAFVQRVIV